MVVIKILVFRFDFGDFGDFDGDMLFMIMILEYISKMIQKTKTRLKYNFYYIIMDKINCEKYYFSFIIYMILYLIFS